MGINSFPQPSSPAPQESGPSQEEKFLRAREIWTRTGFSGETVLEHWDRARNDNEALNDAGVRSHLRDLYEAEAKQGKKRASKPQSRWRK